MATLGDMPIPVVLTRDQVRLIRGMLVASEMANGKRSYLTTILNTINNAEDQATISHASNMPQRCEAWCSHYPNCQHDWTSWDRVDQTLEDYSATRPL